ncbi:MAG TPA: cupin domain-containing protein [Candidatus Limnocylindrales bacterium]|nr:cupin domain-containing protein [Candidatus Limnocylindrales bacterium]
MKRSAITAFGLGLLLVAVAADDKSREQSAYGSAEWRDKITDAAQLPVEKNTWGTLQWLCNGKLMPGAEQTLGLATILPGKQNPVHYHPNCEEVLYVIGGEGMQSYDGRTVLLKAGMTIRIPAHVKHNLINTGTESLRTLVSFSSGDRQTIWVEQQPTK